jgi:hypothetical protein
VTAFDPDIPYLAPDNYPPPDSSHLLSEIGYASLPPPDLSPDLASDLTSDSILDRPPEYGSLSNYGIPHIALPHDAAQRDATQHDALSHDAIKRDGSPSNGSQLVERFTPQWSDLLRRAVEEPGLISEAYSRFHGYSLGNRFAALIQCQERGLEPGPISTFHGWRRLGYAVREGEHALSLCMPLKGTLAREKAASPSNQENRANPLPDPRQPDIEEIEYIRAFVWKPHWFVLSQTQPLDPDNVQPLPPPTLHGWDRALALGTLNIQELPFTHLDGNAQGYAQGKSIAVSPLAVFPDKTLFHEMAHIVLGHTGQGHNGVGPNGQGASTGTDDPLIDTLTLPRSIVEVEAEGVALLLLDTLELPGQEYCRGYIQHWLEGEAIPEKSAQRIFGAADRILSAGLGEGRTRSPTAEDLGWSGADTLPANGTLTANGAAPPNGAIPPNGALRLTTAPEEGDAGERMAQPHALAPTASQPLTAVAIAEAPTVEVLATPRGAEDAWKLHDRLMALHNELHPEDRAERVSIARAVRYVERLDPEAAAQVRDLVCHASLSLKLASARLEIALDSPTLDSPLVGHVSNGGNNGDNAVGDAPALNAPTLPPAREAAARRMVGRDLRGELATEKKRFFEAAKEHGLKVGGKHEKAMLGALSEFLGVPVESRRTPSSRQWSQAASAIATEDLRW